VDSARLVIKYIVNLRFLSSSTSYDVASISPCLRHVDHLDVGENLLGAAKVDHLLRARGAASDQGPVSNGAITVKT
jgi:hypothetical protein